MNFSKKNLLYKFYYLLIIIFITIIVFINNDQINNKINVPEFLNYKSQAIYINIPSKKCYLTLYFTIDYPKLNNSNGIKKINLKEKNYFISFYEHDPVYVQYTKILERHGLIRSYYIYAKNNLFLSPINNNPSLFSNSQIYGINKYQKIFRYLNAHIIFQKNIVYKYYADMKRLFFEDFSYMPETYNYPEEKNIIYNKFKDYRLDLNNLWLVKPQNGYGGHNIRIFDSLKNVKLKKFVITKYITNISLIKGKKYDLRLYVLISGLKPLRIYFYKEGLIRIATEKYILKINSLKNKFIHLTNVCTNILNKKYISPNSTNGEKANIWNIFMYKQFLKSYNIEWDNIREKIKDIIIKSIISLYKKLIEENDKAMLSDQSFYEILGFDILITNDFIPILIEINWTPSMFFSNYIDKIIKPKLFIDTLNIIGIIPYSRKNGKVINNKFKYMHNLNNNIDNALCELERPKGDYELIFPTKETIKEYKKYFINIEEENIKFWEKILTIS